jgi:hypothetical protein
MESLKSNKDKLIDIIKKVNNLDNLLFRHYSFQNIPIYKNTLSIIMTACNRSNQVYKTLKTIEQSSFKNVHIIIVDDSDIDPIIHSMINGYPFYIDLISIRLENKNWINPVVNYNIGFKFIKGSKVVIQNSEVCHVGDVIGWVSKYITDNNYYSFDVKAINSFESNNEIYNINNLTINIYSRHDIFKDNTPWYHSRLNITNYHFLTAMTRNTFNLIKNFSYDYTFGVDWDDNDFVLKIKSKNINIINVFHEENKIGGIHLYHTSSYLKWVNVENNNKIFSSKMIYYNKFNKYFDITENNIQGYKIYNINDNTNLLKLKNEISQFSNCNIFIIYNKNKFTKEMNSFHKNISKKYSTKIIKYKKILILKYYLNK